MITFNFCWMSILSIVDVGLSQFGHIESVHWMLGTPPTPTHTIMIETEQTTRGIQWTREYLLSDVYSVYCRCWSLAFLVIHVESVHWMFGTPTHTIVIEQSKLQEECMWTHEYLWSDVYSFYCRW